MNILIVYPFFLPAYKAGGPVRSIANLIELSAHGEHQFSIVCLNKDIDGTSSPVRTGQWIYFRDNTRVLYAANTLQALKAIHNCRDQLIYMNGLYSIPFNLLPLLIFYKRRFLISPRGTLEVAALNSKKYKKRIYLCLIRRLIFFRNVQFHATSILEQANIEKVFKCKSRVVENVPMMIRNNDRKRSNEIFRLVSLCRIGPLKSIFEVLQALEKIDLPLIYDIYGPIGDEEYWKGCRSIIERMPANVTINYHGPIEPSKITSILFSSDVLIQVSKSENHGHSLLEAMAAGVPVITSHHVPWRSLEAYHAGTNIEIETTAIKNAISQFMYMDESAITKWRIGAKNYFNKAMDLKDLQVRYNKMFAIAALES